MQFITYRFEPQRAAMGGGVPRHRPHQHGAPGYPREKLCGHLAAWLIESPTVSKAAEISSVPARRPATYDGKNAFATKRPRTGNITTVPCCQNTTVPGGPAPSGPELEEVTYSLACLLTCTRCRVDHRVLTLEEESGELGAAEPG